MKIKLYLLPLFSLALLPLWAQQPPVPPKPSAPAAAKTLPKEVAARRLAAIKQGGGMVMPPAGSGPAIAVAALCNDPVTGAVMAATAEIGRTVMLPLRYQALTPAATLWQTAAGLLAGDEVAFAVLVVDDAALPGLLAAPEAGWAVVNIAPLREGADTAQLERRVSQEVWRGVCFAMGAADSAVNKCVMSAVTKASDLDELGPHANPEYLNKMLQRAKAAGILQVRPVLYRKAVEEGWAPPPANEEQQRVWDEVKAAAATE